MARKTKNEDGKIYEWRFVGCDCANCEFAWPCSGDGSHDYGYNASPDCGYEWVEVTE